MLSHEVMVNTTCEALNIIHIITSIHTATTPVQTIIVILDLCEES